MQCRDFAKEWQKTNRSEHSIPTRGLPLRNTSCRRTDCRGNNVLGRQMDCQPKQPEARSSLRLGLGNSNPAGRLPRYAKFRWLPGGCPVWTRNNPTNTGQLDTPAQIYSRILIPNLLSH